MAKPNKVTDLYGCIWHTDDRAKIELECIRQGGTWTVSGKKCGMGLPHHIVEFSRIVWPWYKWHRWSLLHLEELCRPRHRLATFGPSSCVHGATVIKDPVRCVSKTIKEWSESNQHPYVQTLVGPVLASVPFLKGRTDLYEVTLENGHVFRATAEHKVMIQSGDYVDVSSLRAGSLVLGYDDSLLATTSDNDLSVRGEDARRLTRTVQDSQSGCPVCSCCDDEQPLPDQGNGQEHSPSLGDAQGYTGPVYVDVDGVEHRPIRIHPCQSDDRPSSCNELLFVPPSQTPWKSRFAEGTLECVSDQFQSRFLYLSEMRRYLPSRSPDHGSSRTHYFFGDSLSVLPYHNMARPVMVTSIRWSEYGDFYDLQVPGPNHYFAEGAIHHNSGKSCTTALVYLIFYFAYPNNTSVLLSSTTYDDLELRIWGEMKKFFREAKDSHDWLPGFLVDSKRLISSDEKGTEFGRDFRNGVICRAAKIGNKWQIGSGLSPYAGIKNDRIYVAADEFGLMPRGILDALANLTSNPSCCASYLGNLGDLDTPLGEAAEPKNGWDSLPDSNVSRAYDTRWSNGRCVQFVGMDSPNLDYPADAEPYPKLIGRRYIDQCAHDYGRDTPFFNMFAAGAIPRGTMENRIITRQDCERAGAFDEVIWGHETITSLYAMDLSYTIDHGDRTVGRPFAFGRDSEGHNVLAPMAAPTVYAPSDRSDLSIVDQLALQCAAECKRWDIPASRVFYDGTGRSDFTAALMRVMGTAVNPIEFGGTATKRPNFVNRRYEEDLDYRRKKGDLLPCDEVFDKMVSELWFALRALVEAKQARNLDMETVKEASKRLYKASGANRISVEPKAEVKIRLGRSPDLADCAVAAIEGARRLGFALGHLTKETKKTQSGWFSRMQRQLDEARSSTELVVA